MSETATQTATDEPTSRPILPGEGAEEGPPAGWMEFDDEFDAGWDEGSVASGAKSDPVEPEKDPEPPAVESQGEDGQPAEAAQSAAEGEEPVGGQEEPPGDIAPEGAAQESSAGSTEPEPPEPEPEPASSAAPAPTPVDDERERELADLRKQLHDAKSEVGRVRGFLKQRETEAEDLKQQAAAAIPPVDDDEANAKIDKWASEVDPDGAEAVRILIERAKREVKESLQSDVSTLRTEVHTERAQSASEKGVEMLNEYFGGKHWYDEWQSGRVTQWAEDKSSGVKAMLDSEDPLDARDVMELYYRQNPARFPEGKSAMDDPTPTPTPEPAPAATAATVPAAAVPAKPAAPATPAKPAEPTPEQARKVLRREHQQRAAAAAPRSGGSDGLPMGRGDPGTDFDAGWDEGALQSNAA